jgi:hypothetical protein
MDWALIESWQKREIPLRIVLRAVNDVFDSIARRGESRVSVRSLKYCEDAVERLFSDWSSAHVGGKDDLQDSEAGGDSNLETEDELTVHIEACEKKLRALSPGLPVAGTVLTALEELGRLKTAVTPDSCERTLDELETTMNRALIEKKDMLLSDDARKKIESEMSGLGQVNEAAQDVADRLYCKIVREELGIPSLSLYQL